MHEDGTVIHPFITKQENWMDIMLLRALVVEQPFDAPDGKQGAALKEHGDWLLITDSPSYGRTLPLLSPSY
jgi:hypothetical protein